MYSKQDIIIIGQQPWDTEIGSNCKNIALEFSKTNRVLYINSPLDRITLLKSKNDSRTQKRLNVIKGRENGLVKIQDNLWNLYPDCIVESINWLSLDFLYDFFNKRNGQKLSKSIKRALLELKFENVILFNDNEMFKAFYLGELLSPDLSIYYSRDYMLGVDYWKKHGTRLEPLLIAKNNICFANSIYLTEYCRHYNKNSFYVGQGCDIEDFKNSSNFKRPVDLPTGKTIIGYVGALNSIRLDLEIIEHIAIKFPEYLIVLVGPEDEVFLSSTLHEIDNIVFLGQKEVKQLAEYINTFDICINPQLVNPVTIGNYPRKIDEYLALGKPTIATATKTMEAFKDYVYLAQDKEDYIKFIQYALANNSDKLESERKDFAYTHTWKNSVDEMRKQIEIILKTA